MLFMMNTQSMASAINGHKRHSNRCSNFDVPDGRNANISNAIKRYMQNRTHISDDANFIYHPIRVLLGCVDLLHHVLLTVVVPSVVGKPDGRVGHLVYDAGMKGAGDVNYNVATLL